MTHGGGERCGSAGGVQTVLLGGAQIGDRLQTPGQRAQMQGGGRGRLPGLQGHARREFQQHQRVQRIGLAALHQGLSKMADRARIGHHHFQARLFVEQQRQVQPVNAGGLQADSDQPALANPGTTPERDGPLGCWERISKAASAPLGATPPAIHLG